MYLSFSPLLPAFCTVAQMWPAPRHGLPAGPSHGAPERVCGRASGKNKAQGELSCLFEEPGVRAHASLQHQQVLPSHDLCMFIVCTVVD